MTVAALLFDTEGVDEKITSSRGELQGGTLKPYLRYGDTHNTISLGTAGNYLARGVFKEGLPYYKQVDEHGTRTLLPTYHFLVELRRQLSGEIQVGESRFSPAEEIMYEEYQDYVMGATKTGIVLEFLEVLDEWLVDELMMLDHPELNREYSTTHKWMKVEEIGRKGLTWLQMR